MAAIVRGRKGVVSGQDGFRVRAREMYSTSVTRYRVAIGIDFFDCKDGRRTRRGRSREAGNCQSGRLIRVDNDILQDWGLIRIGSGQVRLVLEVTRGDADRGT